MPCGELLNEWFDLFPQIHCADHLSWHHGPWRGQTETHRRQNPWILFLKCKELQIKKQPGENQWSAVDLFHTERCLWRNRLFEKAAALLKGSVAVLCTRQKSYEYTRVLVFTCLIRTQLDSLDAETAFESVQIYIDWTKYKRLVEKVLDKTLVMGRWSLVRKRFGAANRHLVACKMFRSFQRLRLKQCNTSLILTGLIPYAIKFQGASI